MRQTTLILLALLCVLSAFAVEEQQVQGNYVGEAETRAQVIAEGNGNYRVHLTIGGARVELSGKTAEKRGNPSFDGIDNLVEGDYENGAINLRLNNKSNTRMQLKRVELGSPTLGTAPPGGAVVLMDGDDLDEWETAPLKWHIRGDGSVEVANPDLISKRDFGDHKLHVEFRTPFMPHERGQARGNSGVYLHGVYEVQVLDSFGQDPADNLCGGIYQIAVPSKNMVLPPLEWQTYDITFRAPRFSAAGKKTENARITVIHNGETIHDDLELPGLTGGAMRDTEEPLGPLKLQHHHDSVRYRNVWALPLD